MSDRSLPLSKADWVLNGENQMLRCLEWIGLLRLSSLFITIGGSLDSNARTFCRVIDDCRGRGWTH